MTPDGSPPSAWFSLGFSRSPRNDFGVFAKGYHHAAQTVSKAVLAKVSFGDYDAYPVVFLYRHALELHLKNVIYKAVELCKFHRIEDIDSRLYNRHELPPLAKRASEILPLLFPGDKGIKSLGDGLRNAAAEISRIDDTSFTYRYPIRKDGSPAVNRSQRVNLADFSSQMDSVLGELEIVDFGLAVEKDKVQETLDILASIAAGDDDEAGEIIEAD